MEILVKKNEELEMKLTRFMSKIMNVNTEEPKKPHKISNMLGILLESAKVNAGRKGCAKRYEEVVKELGHLWFHIGNLQLYEIFAANLEIPSVSAIRRMIYKHEVLTEGKFRIKELKIFLQQRKYPMKVHLSEDSTVVAPRIQYYAAKNQIVGLNLPMDLNGLPVVGSYPATSAKIIASYFSDNDVSHYAHCIIAQPPIENSPSFVVAMFGTNNKYSAIEVNKRWQWTLTEMAKEGIEVCSVAADGDWRALKCMIFQTIKASPNHSWQWYKAEKTTSFFCVQDPTHIGNKLKSKLLSPSAVLPMGKKCVASRGHLVELIDKHKLKGQHTLCHSDINPRDKMNFNAMRRMCDQKVTGLLQSKVQDSEGTVIYLIMMREVVDSFMRLDLLPLQRIEILWKWVFFLRMWREWVMRTEGYNLDNNFVTRNSYICIELNAHSLIQSVVKFRESENHNLFVPDKSDSQPSEKTFRRLRSSKVVFSILEMQNILRRFDTLASCYLNLEDKIIFPRHHKHLAKSVSKTHIPVSLPEDYEIERTVLTAFELAKTIAIGVGILKRSPHIPMPLCAIQPISPAEMEIREPPDEDIDMACMEMDSDSDKDDCDERDVVNEIPDVLEDLLIVSTGGLGLKTYNEVNVTETCPYVEVLDGNGNPAVIRKSSLCWLMRSGDTKISADRLQRVQSAHGSVTESLYMNEITIPSKEDFVSLGDWAAFKSEDGSLVIGRILAFSYLSGTSKKNKEYSRLEAPTQAPAENARGVGCLCTWFKIEKNLTLSVINMDVHGYYDLNNYICTVPRPRSAGTKLKLGCTIASIRKFR